jgi:pteridine reductase
MSRADRPVALVTGGTRRVGLAIARALATAGFDLVLTYRSDREGAERAAKELATSGARAQTRALDLSDLGQVEAAAAAVARELPRLDALVHNASVYEPTPLASLDAERLIDHYRVNAAAPLLLTARLRDTLAASTRPSGGSVVAMADIHAMGRPRRDLSAYLMSKAALVEMVRVLARELAPKVRVNGVAPGVVAFPDQGPDADAAMQERYLARVPMQRSGTVEEAAEAVRWLVTDATYTTGQIVRVDGGRWLA